MNCEPFWETKREFAEKYGVEFANFGGPAPTDPAALAAGVRRQPAGRHRRPAPRPGAGRLPGRTPGRPGRERARRSSGGFAAGQRAATRSRTSGCTTSATTPQTCTLQPGASAANRAALAKWGAWVNAFGAKEYGRPLFLASSADLAESTNISGFGKGYGDFPGYGWYERKAHPEGVLLPQEITEFANAGMLAGMATVNFAADPEKQFDGFWGACSTYGSFSYLKYGMLRLFSQLAQDCQLKVGKVLWVAGHSGPETADDSRTHFGIFAPGVTQLFPEGAIINLHPWEYNEVPVLLGAPWGRRRPSWPCT